MFFLVVIITEINIVNEQFYAMHIFNNLPKFL